MSFPTMTKWLASRGVNLTISKTIPNRYPKPRTIITAVGALLCVRVENHASGKGFGFLAVLQDPRVRRRKWTRTSLKYRKSSNGI